MYWRPTHSNNKTFEGSSNILVYVVGLTLELVPSKITAIQLCEVSQLRRNETCGQSREHELRRESKIKYSADRWKATHFLEIQGRHSAGDNGAQLSLPLTCQPIQVQLKLPQVGEASQLLGYWPCKKWRSRSFQNNEQVVRLGLEKGSSGNNAWRVGALFKSVWRDTCCRR